MFEPISGNDSSGPKIVAYTKAPSETRIDSAKVETPIYFKRTRTRKTTTTTTSIISMTLQKWKRKLPCLNRDGENQ
jgi:hypothetical protein